MFGRVREVGATTHEQHFLKNTTLPITLPNNRRIDILVTGSSLSSLANTEESSLAELVAEFKHISKRRKRN